MSFYCPVIGVGAISAAGSSVSTGYENVLKSKSFLTPLSILDWSRDEIPLVGEIKDFQQNCCYSRTEALAVTAIEEAILDINLNGLKVGLTVATTVGGVDRSEKEYLSERAGNEPTSQDRYSRHEAGALSGFLAKIFNLDGFHTVSTACSSGIHGIGMARRLIELGEYDAVIAVGTDALLKLTLNGFDSLLLIDPKGPHPFDADRIGISIGEAAGAVLLASKDATKKLNKNPIAYISGWGASADAHHMTAPHPNGDGAKRAITEAFEDANISASDIDWILTHGTSTIDNDLAEVRALKSIFNGKIAPFTSLKGYIGHTLAASGSVEVAYAIEALKSGKIPDTVGFKKIDPEIGVEPSSARKIDMKNILKTAFGFGGNNGALIISGDEN
jgi:3-oxoacyl-[acyl-carrier-protein] synthase II